MRRGGDAFVAVFMRGALVGIALAGIALVGIALVGGLAACGDSMSPQPKKSCTSATCAEGCCEGDVCVVSGPTSCGLGGVACEDCTAAREADTCVQGACVCAGAGTRCPAGATCDAKGCGGSCAPKCAGKCAGAKDACGGTCAVSDCAGCCDTKHVCFSIAQQSDTRCGVKGAVCEDCTASRLTDVCSDDGCVCMGAGAPCPGGTTCVQRGCDGLCKPQCAGKCAGAEDGCGGTCTVSDCAGCCDTKHICITTATQGDTRCGVKGEACTDCTLWAQRCDGKVHRCLSARDDSALFLLQKVPRILSPGQNFQAMITVENNGKSLWTAAAGYKLGAQAPQDNSLWGLSRVTLDAKDAIAPGQEKTFVFSATAPLLPGVYNFQWRMVKEGVAWFGHYTSYVPVIVGASHVAVCGALRALANKPVDASSTIQKCIDAAASGSVVELPAGVYRIDKPIQISAHAITLRTEKTDVMTAPCRVMGHACAELRASTAFEEMGGILQVLAPGSVIDHLVINGNKKARAMTKAGKSCAAGSNSYGYNMRLACSHCTLTNSVTVDALCGTGCELSGKGDHIVVWRNIIARNGVHNAQGMWADGLTAHDYADSIIAKNDIYDNTDVDLIFGGCPRCLIAENHIWHSPAQESGSFAALMLHAWPKGSTSGDFKGAVTTGNRVDCSAKHRCGFGLYLGADAWYRTDSYGGRVHENIVRNAAQGVLIDDVHDMSVWDNPVINPATSTRASCGTRATSAYAMGTRSKNVDISKDTLSTHYNTVDWDGCIPNWWK